MKKNFFLGLTLLIGNLTMNAQVSLTVSNPSPLCVGGSALLTAGGASTYVWSPATGLSATTGATVKASPSVTTTYTVTGTTAGQSDTKQIKVIVDPTCVPVCNTTGTGGSFNWTGIAHYYTGDSTLKDLIGHKDFLTPLNSEGFANGIINKGFYVNGNNQYYLFPNNTFNPTEDFTISMWFKADVLTGGRAFLYNNSGAIIIEISGNGIRSFTNGANNITGTTGLSPSTWYHVLLIYKKGVTQSLYINNNLEGYILIPPNLIYGTTQIQSIGAYGTTNDGTSFNYFFTGVIDEIALFNRAITQEERAALYNAGAGKQAPY